MLDQRRITPVRRLSTQAHRSEPIGHDPIAGIGSTISTRRSKLVQKSRWGTQDMCSCSPSSGHIYDTHKSLWDNLFQLHFVRESWGDCCQSSFLSAGMTSGMLTATAFVVFSAILLRKYPIYAYLIIALCAAWNIFPPAHQITFLVSATAGNEAAAIKSAQIGYFLQMCFNILFFTILPLAATVLFPRIVRRMRAV